MTQKTQVRPAIGQRWRHNSEGARVQTIAEGPKYDRTLPRGTDGEWWWCSDCSGIYTEEMRRGNYVLVED